MDSLPSGTVTMLFSDIEGSTRLLSRLGPRYGEVLSGQRAILRSAFERWHGHEMGTEGDSFFVVFRSAGDAVNVCVEGQRELTRHSWPDEVPVRVRMGVHTGEPIRHEDGYVGMDVHVAARIAATAHGGQTVLSDATAHLVCDRLPESAHLVDLGRHRLKDIDQPLRLHQLDVPGFEQDFPPLKSIGTTTSLPTSATGLVGRDGELRELSALLSLDEVRLLTLTGPGGSGKTRLAIALAARVAERFSDGVYFVPLASVTTAEVMRTTMAEVLRVSVESRVQNRFLDQVAELRGLLVLDNLEQLPDAAAVVSELLAAAPGIVVVATSRRPLHLQAEHEHPVPTLTLPQDAGLGDAAASGAVQLFVRQATMVKPAFALTADNAADVVEVCRRLDGLPLALELAAARTKLLGPRALLDRLDRGLGLRAGGADRPTRQQTLRAAIAWSYDLLDEPRQAFFRRLGVFAGGCDMAAVAAVAGGSADPLEEIAELVDASLVTVREGPDGEPRVSMLETIRGFALERLKSEDDVDRIRLRHTQHYLERVEVLAPQLKGSRQLDARSRLETEHDNIREALAWSLDTDCVQRPSPDIVRLGIRIAFCLRWFWMIGNYREEGYRWYERAVQLAPAEGPELAAALLGLGRLSDFDQERKARTELTRALQIFRRLGDDSLVAETLVHLAEIEASLDNIDDARQMLQESVQLARESHDRVRLGSALAALSWFEGDLGNYDRAIDLVVQSRDLARDRGDERATVLMGNNLAVLLNRASRSFEAKVLLADLADGALRLRDRWVDYYIIGTAAEVFAELGEDERAVRLLAGLDLIGERLRARASPRDDADLERTFEKVRTALGPTVWDRAYQDGRSRSTEEALGEIRTGRATGD